MKTYYVEYDEFSGRWCVTDGVTGCDYPTKEEARKAMWSAAFGDGYPTPSDMEA